MKRNGKTLLKYFIPIKSITENKNFTVWLLSVIVLDEMRFFLFAFYYLSVIKRLFKFIIHVNGTNVGYFGVLFQNKKKN